VFDVAFSVLEDSREVDWRAPEFGSLWQHFESFIIHGFQGAFMGRATSFRISVIKAQFCKILLAQILDDIVRKNVLSFRSQWDVASLAKVIDYLGLPDEDDPEFWDSYVDGVHVGVKSRVKALKKVDTIARDGPLSIFCRLGHLAASNIPYHLFGLERKDIMKVLEIQDNLRMAQRLPLNGASDTVWEDLDQLRVQVLDIYDATSGGIGDIGNAGEEGELLLCLLRRIDDVRNLRVTHSEGPRNSGHAEERPSSAVPQVEVNAGSSSSTLTTETSEGEYGFEGVTYILIPRASINLQPESDSHTISSSQSIVQSRPRRPIGSGSPVTGQRPQFVPSGPRRNALITLANPIISLLPQ